MQAKRFPDFLIVGAAKAGTTSLHNYLNQHPEIFMSSIKEPYFFSFYENAPLLKGPYDKGTERQIIRNTEEYLNLFNDAEENMKLGECSNSYLFFYNETIKNIKKLMSKPPKIIIILRNPYERTFSHYSQHVMIGHEDLSFIEAIKNEKKRQADGWRWHYQYSGQSLYYEATKAYIENFGKENVLVLLFDDLKSDKHKLLKDIFKFLNCIDEYRINDSIIYNKSGRVKNMFLQNIITNQDHILRKSLKRFFSDKTKKKIINIIKSYNTEKIIMNKEYKIFQKEYFEKDIEKLEKYLAIDLNNWKL